MANIVTIHERIKLLVEKKAENKNTLFAQTLGVSEANIRGYIKGVVPKADVLAKIVSSYDDVDPTWLLTGEGPMLKTSTSSAHEAPCPDEKERKTEKNGEKQRRSEKIENILLESISYQREALREFHSYQLAQWQEHSLPTCL